MGAPAIGSTCGQFLVRCASPMVQSCAVRIARFCCSTLLYVVWLSSCTNVGGTLKMRQISSAWNLRVSINCASSGLMLMREYLKPNGSNFVPACCCGLVPTALYNIHLLLFQRLVADKIPVICPPLPKYSAPKSSAALAKPRFSRCKRIGDFR